MSDSERILPGGRGEQADQIAQDESYDVRRRLDPLEDGWLVSTVGENIYTSLSSTSSVLTANQLMLFYSPDRVRRVLCREARLSVVTASAGATLRTALYIYDNREVHRRLVKVPGSEASFDASTTGRKTTRLSRDVELPIEAKLFIGFWSSSAAVEVEGSAPGVGASTVVRRRAISSVSAPLGTSYDFNQIATLDTAQGVPLVAYLSPDAMQVF